jgi:hypothetical protein
VEDRQSKRTKEKNPEERVLIVNRPHELRLAWRENYTACGEIKTFETEERRKRR